MRPHVEVTHATTKDIAALADSHARCLEGYYTSELGTFYLKHFFWPAVILDHHSATFIARHKGRIIGFIICTLNSTKLKSRIMRHRLFTGNAFILFKCIFSPLVRASTAQNFRSLFRAPDKALPHAELFLIGVDGAHRNLGVGRILMTKMAAYFDAQNCRQSHLRVRQNNAPGIRLYENMGYRIVREIEEMGDNWLLMVKA